MTSILFTGGGTAGHVTPNIALIDEARQRRWEVYYIGSADGIESSMIGAEDVPFYAIASGKLRRYFSWQNFIDPFKVLWGVIQSLVLLLQLKPDVIFSKGGFVSVPVVVAGWLLRIPVLSHESDVTPGLANRLAFPFVGKICINFEETAAFLPAGKPVVTGTPIRSALLNGDAGAGLAYLQLDRGKPLLLVFGGSLGAKAINEQVRAVLGELLDIFNVVHVVGAGEDAPGLEQPGYIRKAFIGAEFGDVLAAADVVVSRAGANSIYELFTVRKPHLLIPLTRTASRGDQIENARNFEALGYSCVLEEHELSNDRFLKAIDTLYRDRDSVRAKLEQFERKDSVALIFSEIENVLAR